MAAASRGERTRDDIVAAGVRLFSLHGYHHTSTGDLLAAVSLSKGAFYHHFKSKEEMALAVLRRVREAYEHDVAEAVRQVEDRGKRFGVLLARLATLNGSGQWDFCLLLARLVQEVAEEETALAEQVRETVNWFIDFVAETIEDGQDAGDLRRDLPARDLGALLAASLLGAAAGEELRDGGIAVEGVLGQLGVLLRRRD